MTVIGSVGEAGKSFDQGDWVTVYGQITTTTKADDIDITVTVFSHNEEYPILVEPRRVEPVAKLPEFAQRCISMLLLEEVSDNLFTRCVVHHGHSGCHSDGGDNMWNDEDSYGWIEVH